MAGIEINQADIARVETLLAGIKNGAKKAMVTAINKTATTTKVQVKKKLGEKLNLKASRIDNDLSIEKATYTKISGRVKAVGEPIGLVNFAGAQLQQGVKVRVYKSSSPTLIKHAYRATAKGAEHLFWRMGRDMMPAPKRFPTGKKASAPFKKMCKKYYNPFGIERLTGPRIEDVLAKPEIFDPLNNTAADLLQSNLVAQTDDILRRYRL